MIDVVVPIIDRVVIVRHRESGSVFPAALTYVSGGDRQAFWWFSFTKRLGPRPTKPKPLPRHLEIVRAANGGENLAFLRRVADFKKGVLKP